MWTFADFFEAFPVLVRCGTSGKNVDRKDFLPDCFASIWAHRGEGGLWVTKVTLLEIWCLPKQAKQSRKWILPKV